MKGTLVQDSLYSHTMPESTLASGEPGDELPQIGQLPPAKQDSQWQKLARILVLIGALGIAVVGLLGGAAGLVLTLLNPASDSLTMVVASGSFLTLSLALGLGLAWQAGQAMAGRPSSRFEPRRIGIWALLFVAALILGQTVLSTRFATLVAFPLLHIAATALPPLVIVGLVGRKIGPVTRWRDMVLELGSGAFLSTSLAFTLEVVAILALFVAGVAAVAIQPGGAEALRSLANRFQDPAWLQNPANLSSVVASPLVMVVALLLTAGIIPIIEETVKTLGVGLLAYRRPSLPQAVLWGVACGAGFAMAEAMFNTASGLQGWSGVVILRVGASTLHSFTGGLMGLGWYYLLVERRWGRTLGLYASAITLHALWNALATGMSLVSLRAMGPGTSAAGQGLAGIGSIAMLLLLVLLALSMVVGLAVLARYAAAHSGPAPQPTAQNAPPAANAGITGE